MWRWVVYSNGAYRDSPYCKREEEALCDCEAGAFTVRRLDHTEIEVKEEEEDLC
jgi:hypothetical protein